MVNSDVRQRARLRISPPARDPARCVGELAGTQSMLIMLPSPVPQPHSAATAILVDELHAGCLEGIPNCGNGPVPQILSAFESHNRVRRYTGCSCQFSHTKSHGNTGHLALNRGDCFRTVY